MKIKWLGHSCFLIESNDKKIVTDPYDSKVGTLPPDLAADIVTVSHQHYDHNYTAGVGGNPQIFNAVGNFIADDIRVRGVATFHDIVQGAERGENIVFIIESEGLRVAHLGDLGHVLTPEQLAEIGQIDICLIPVGGTYTIGPAEAAEIVNQLKPKLVLPMHYKTDQTKLPIGGVEEFLDKTAWPTERATELEIDQTQLSEITQKVILFS